MNFKDETIRKLKPMLIVVTYGILLTFLLFNLDVFTGVFSKLMGLLRPFFYALGIAFVLNLPMKFIEETLLKKWCKLNRFTRPISIVLTLVFALIVLFLLSSIIIPQIIDSLNMLINNFQGYVNGIIKMINDIILSNDWLRENYEPFTLDLITNAQWQEFLKTATNFVTEHLPGLYNNTVGIAIEFGNWFMGFMLSLYLLTSKEVFIRQAKKLIAAFLPKNVTVKVVGILTHANRIFSSFISGQLTEAFILAFLFYIGMTLLKMPYALLISAIIGVFSIIPMFGALIGMFFGAILILAINPIQVIWFVIFFQLLQQFEGNVIYPKVVGDSVGLPGIWVLLSIVVFGGLYGLFGMLISVPTTALLYSLTSQFINHLLEKRNITVEEEITYLE